MNHQVLGRISELRLSRNCNYLKDANELKVFQVNQDDLKESHYQSIMKIHHHLFDHVGAPQRLKLAYIHQYSVQVKLGSKY